MPLTLERSADTDAVIVALRGVNDEISYVNLARQSGLTLQRAKQVLPSARRALVSESGILFGVIQGEGLRLLNDEDKARKPDAFKKKVFKGAGRELKHLATISDFNALAKTTQHKVTIDRTTLNVLRQQAAVRAELPKTRMTPQPMANVSQLIKAKMPS